jgi:hypothetical protein
MTQDPSPLVLGFMPHVAEAHSPVGPPNQITLRQRQRLPAPILQSTRSLDATPSATLKNRFRRVC